MKIKSTRNVPGTFAEIALFIRSLTQILYDNIQDFKDPYYLWLIEIRCFLRYMLMPKITTSQVEWFSAVTCIKLNLKYQKLSITHVAFKA